MQLLGLLLQRLFLALCLQEEPHGKPADDDTAADQQHEADDQVVRLGASAPPAR